MLRSLTPDAAEVETGSLACPAWLAHVRAAGCQAGHLPSAPGRAGGVCPEARRTAPLCSCKPGPSRPTWWRASGLLPAVGRTGHPHRQLLAPGAPAGPLVVTAAAAPGASSAPTLASPRGVAKPRWPVPGAHLLGCGVMWEPVLLVPAPPHTALQGPPALTSQQT